MSANRIEPLNPPCVFVVYGVPQPAGSKRAFPIRRKNGQLGVSVTDANPRSAQWKAAVALAAKEAWGRREPSARPMLVMMRFFQTRPASHFGTGKNADKLKESAPRFPCGKPDALKLARGTEDALTGIVYRDDAQTVQLVVEKHYGSRPMVAIQIEELAG